MATNPRRSSSSPYATTSPSHSHTTRYAGAHSNSSAFSKNAQPNEDWTQVSDLAERRRIQNRIAQRNYRQKLKRRLEELEHRSVSPSASPERSPSHESERVASSTTNSGRRRRTSEQPSASSSGRGGHFDVQPLNLFSQPYDEHDSRMLGYQFCAQPSPPPPPSPPLPESTAYAGVEHSRFSPAASQVAPWVATTQQPQLYGAPSHATTAGSYASSYAYSPNLSTTSTSASHTEGYMWPRGGQDENWGSSWSYAPHSESQQQAPHQPWQSHESPTWQDHYHDAASSKFTDDGLFPWAQLDGYPTPPHSADLNTMINPFDEFLNMAPK